MTSNHSTSTLGTFGHIQYTPKEHKQVSCTLSKQLGPEFISKRAGPGNSQVTYIEGWKAIELANEVLGFNGWSHSITDITVDYVDMDSSGRVSLGISATVRVTLKDGTFHEDIGYGSIENAKSKSMAFEKAKKEAVTDGLKRGLKAFGNVLGNCLYDKEYIKNIQKIKLQNKPVMDPTLLHRHSLFKDSSDPSKGDVGIKKESFTNVKQELIPIQPIHPMQQTVKQEIGQKAQIDSPCFSDGIFIF